MASSRRRLATLAFTALVVTWWLLIAGVVIQVMPTPAASSPGTWSGPVPGRRARVHQPGIRGWLIPVERRAFDELHRGVRESDEDAIERALASSEWIPAEDGQAVLAIEIDGEVVQVQLLEGQQAGHRAWLRARNLRP